MIDGLSDNILNDVIDWIHIGVITITNFLWQLLQVSDFDVSNWIVNGLIALLTLMKIIEMVTRQDIFPGTDSSDD